MSKLVRFWISVLVLLSVTITPVVAAAPQRQANAEFSVTATHPNDFYGWDKSFPKSPNLNDGFTLEVNVTPVDSGTVIVAPEQITYTLGQTVTLTAIPEFGWAFDRWIGDVHPDQTFTILMPLQITMDGNKVITATFKQIPIYTNYLPLVARNYNPADWSHFTVLHTNDIHGRLQPDSSGRGGLAYMAYKVDAIREQRGAKNVVLMDAGDAYLAAPPISQLLMGESTIDIFNMIGYDLAAYGNHEFDMGQTVLISRTNQSEFPWLGANVVISGTAWENPDWALPYITLTVGIAPNEFVLGVIGLAGEETPEVTLKGTTDDLVFKDLTETIIYYYDEVLAQSDALVVIAHMGTADSGEYDGLATIARKLVDADKPVDLMIGGHQHQAMATPLVISDTTIVSAGFYGRWLGQLDLTVHKPSKSLYVNNYQLITINNSLPAEQAVADRIEYWADVVAPIIVQPVASTFISLTRNYNEESLMGNIVADSMLWKADAYDDDELNGSVHIAFTNPGGLRADITVPEDAALPYTVTWGATFEVLPFGNTLFLMGLTGEQVLEILVQATTLYKGMIQSSGIAFHYNLDTNDVYSVTVGGVDLDPTATYRVVTNNFLAGGQDGWGTFADGTSRWDTYVDMHLGFNEYLGDITPVEASDIPMGRAIDDTP